MHDTLGKDLRKEESIRVAPRSSAIRHSEGFIMTMLKKIVAALVSLAAALLLSIGLAGTATAQPVAIDPTAAPVTGTLADATGAVTGTFDVQNVVAENGTLQAVGPFTGTVTDAAGHSTQGTQQLAITVDLAQSAGPVRSWTSSWARWTWTCSDCRCT